MLRRSRVTDISQVTHTPSAVDDATATTAVYLIISAMRQFARAEVACRNLEWKNKLPLARDPEHKTLGIIGMGGIGTVTARRLALGWGMKVIYHNRRPLSQPPKDFSAEYKDSLEEHAQSVPIPFFLSHDCNNTPIISSLQNVAFQTKLCIETY